uniref:Ig-like domain-containing protein n=1 Tax=Laticauda laticaudata TaxID=8630 RepID=A0A8C5S0W2_LATLA
MTFNLCKTNRRRNAHLSANRFQARVSARPRPEILWFHNQQLMLPSKDVVFHFDESTGTAILIIVDAFSEHAGQYSCQARNSAGDATCTATLTVTSEGKKLKPSFLQKLKYQSVLVGEPVVFQCKLSAYPSPKVTWFHNNKQIPQSLRKIIKNKNCMDMHDSSLEVKDVLEEDSGSYKIFAINSEGSAESTASLLVIQGSEQNAKYLEFLRKSKCTQEHIEHMMQKKRDDRVKVDLRCIGSPFDKKQETEKALTNFETQKPEVVMSDTITFSINEPAV